MKKKIKEVKGKLYSRTQFPTYKNRVKFRFTLDDGNYADIDIYTTETEKDKIIGVIDGLKKSQVSNVEFINISSKEHDDAMSKFIDEWLNK